MKHKTLHFTYKRASTEDELHQILSIQQHNLKSNLPDIEIAQEGFVTVAHDFKLLKKMNEVCPHIIAKSGSKVAGYALCMHPKFANDIELLKPMFEKVETIRPKIENYIAMGQICVEKNYRGQGIFRKLYERMRDAVQPEFNWIITEVDTKNTRSIGAHYAVGFKDLVTYRSCGQDWKIVRLC